MTVSIPNYKAKLKRMGDDQLANEIACVAETKKNGTRKNNSYNQSNKVIADVQIMRLQRQLHACFEECVIRDTVGLYTQNYVTTRENHLCMSHPTPEKLARLHMGYSFPGYVNAKKANAVNSYAEDGATINGYMRRDLNLPDPYNKHRDVLRKSMQPTPFDIALFRGLSIEQKLKPGELFLEKGFLGLSGSKSVAQDFAKKRADHPNMKCYMLHIDIPAGTPYLSIWNSATRYKDYVDLEQEIILADNLTLEMVKRTSGKAADGYQEWHARVVL